jgi:hypothetical protein
MRGGNRYCAGRPSGTGRYGEKTVVIRVPASRVEDVRRFLERDDFEPTCPLYDIKDIDKRGSRTNAGRLNLPTSQ